MLSILVEELREALSDAALIEKLVVRGTRKRCHRGTRWSPYAGKCMPHDDDGHTEAAPTDRKMKGKLDVPPPEPVGIRER